MKMVSGEIEVEPPVVIYDYATSDDHVVGDIPIGQALAAVGEPNSPSELAQRLAVAVAMLWPEIADADVFLPEKGRPLRGVRDARAGAQLLASLHSVWGPMAARGLMPVTPTLLPGDVASGRGSTMSTPIFSGKSLEGFLVVQRHPNGPGFTSRDLEAIAALAEGVGGILPAARERASAVPASWLEQDLLAAGDLQRSFLPSRSRRTRRTSRSSPSTCRRTPSAVTSTTSSTSAAGASSASSATSPARASRRR